ncbi:DUF4294 domain-containing protein [Flavobacterium sp. CYK-4]|uniref:DUF4294 domain-containing protein n=1 Tax=Flavobacterium lotistagni TaxID=2709660 RepID=UPI00140BEB68|nr:DUF4294 domain-containing protein [Flavobacterium lotistagni]NHM07898.1 DUF4294 domain-containing protein [Flavobacterium lotistagni]
MKFSFFTLSFFLFLLPLQAQIIEQDTTKMGYVLKDTDTISEPIQLEEITVYRNYTDAESRKQFLLLRNRVYKVYPYAKVAADRLTVLNKNMNALKTNREKRKYFKIVEDYMQNEFEPKLKKLSRKQGQILVKLINRQTGFTTYELIKDYKSGWKAFWSNATANAFDISLKRKYNPYEDNEDFLIETILVRAFDHGRLVKQEAAIPIDYDKLSDYWEEKAKQVNK